MPAFAMRNTQITKCWVSPRYAQATFLNNEPRDYQPGLLKTSVACQAISERSGGVSL